MILKTEFKDFAARCREGNLIPVVGELPADLETPVSVLGRLADEENVFLFESVEGGERFGRYSFIGLKPRGVFTVEDGHAYYRENGETRELVPDDPRKPIFALRKLLAGIKAVETPGLPPLFGGAVGYIGYETSGEFEELPPPKKKIDAPTTAMMITDEMIVFDNVRHSMLLIVCSRVDEYKSEREAYDDAVRRLGELEKMLKKPLVLPAEPERREPPARLVPNMTREDYCAIVEKARAAIQAGEIIQVVPSQKFTAPLESSPFALYRALRMINPSPYTFFLRIGERTLVGSSPETMVKLERGRSSLRPIAGTRKRGSTPARDRELADELLGDEKERAEHLMLVDLGRNDLGRTARPGSVQVRHFMNVERYSHVMHLVSDVDAELDEKFDAFDLLAGTFPAGTLSGAPKVRAMEIINELEPEPRGVYGGGVGYFSYTGNLDLAITIRTIEIRNGQLSIQVGAGVVFDSVPEKEYEETINKAKAMFEAIRFAGNLRG